MSTTYVGAIETAEKFGDRLETEAIRRGLWNAETVVVLGDGAVWVRNLVEQHFYGAIQIVDFYHAKNICINYYNYYLILKKSWKNRSPYGSNGLITAILEKS